MPSNNSKHLIFDGDRFSRLTVISFSHHDKRWRRHYLVRCDCGNEKTVQGTLLRSGNTRSCGCLAKEAKATKRKPDNGGELTAVILGYKRHAAKRGLSWNLEREHVRGVISMPCHYCGSTASNQKTTKNTIHPFKYNGIDRVDNAVGYEESNVVSCCFVCNRAKGDMSVEEFREWMIKIEAMASQWGLAPNAKGSGAGTASAGLPGWAAGNYGEMKMQQRPIVMNNGNMIGATERAKARVKDWCDLAEEVTNDARKNERLKRHECKACFYASRIGGAAMTTRPCMSCGSEEMYGSTATDVLCMDCATKHGLCKHCGGDLEMRTRRKDWPETPNVK